MPTHLVPRAIGSARVGGASLWGALSSSCPLLLLACAKARGPALGGASRGLDAGGVWQARRVTGSGAFLDRGGRGSMPGPQAQSSSCRLSAGLEDRRLAHAPSSRPASHPVLSPLLLLLLLLFLWFASLCCRCTSWTLPYPPPPPPCRYVPAYRTPATTSHGPPTMEHGPGWHTDQIHASRHAGMGTSQANTHRVSCAGARWRARGVRERGARKRAPARILSVRSLWHPTRQLSLATRPA